MGGITEPVEAVTAAKAAERRDAKMKWLAAFPIAVLAQFQPGQADAAEVWNCTLKPDQPNAPSIQESYEINGPSVLRSPGDYSNQRLAYTVIQNTAGELIAMHRAQGSVILVLIDKQSAKIKEIGTGVSGDFVDVWLGQCVKPGKSN